LSGPVEIGGFFYPAYRLVIIAFGLAVAGLLYLLVAKSRIGMWVRAGASNREMTEALGINVQRLFTAVFVFGAALCALAGGLLGPLLAVQVGMGESVLILAFVVIIIGGIGSIRGALVGSLIVGTVDTLGRALLPTLLRATAAGRCRFNARPGAGLDPDLPADGRHPVLQAARPVSGARLMAFYRPAPYQKPVAIVLLLAALALPSLLSAFGQEFYVGFATRVLIFALAASSLNLVLGFGGMFSLGHAAFFGPALMSRRSACRPGSAMRCSPSRWRCSRPACWRCSSAPSACARAASISS
jgi:ABC-type branched-subunit amino acid transport system permease subunit